MGAEGLINFPTEFTVIVLVHKNKDLPMLSALSCYIKK